MKVRPLVMSIIAFIISLCLLPAVAHAAPITPRAVITGPQKFDKQFYLHGNSVIDIFDHADVGSTVQGAQYLANHMDVLASINRAVRRGVHVQLIIGRGYDDRYSVKFRTDIQKIVKLDKSGRSWVRIQSGSPMMKGGVQHAKFFRANSMDKGKIKWFSQISTGNIHYTNTNSSWNGFKNYTNDKALYDGLGRYFNDMLKTHDRPSYGKGKVIVSSSKKVRVYMFPGGPDVKYNTLRDVSCKGGTLIESANYAGTNARTKVAKMARQKAAEGCQVRYIVNIWPEKNTYGDDFMRELMKSGKGRSNIQVRNGYYPGAYMHLKTTLFRYSDGRTITLDGSQNDTGTGMRVNTELVSRNTDVNTWKSYHAGFARVWAKSRPLSTVPKLSASKQIDTLSKETLIENSPNEG